MYLYVKPLVNLGASKFHFEVVLASSEECEIDEHTLMSLRETSLDDSLASANWKAYKKSIVLCLELE